MDDGDDHQEDVEEEDDGHVDQGLGQPVLPVAQQLLLVPLVEQRGWAVNTVTTSASKRSTRAFSWLKAATTAIKTLCQMGVALTPRSLNVKLGP